MCPHPDWSYYTGKEVVESVYAAKRRDKKGTEIQSASKGVFLPYMIRGLDTDQFLLGIYFLNK